MDQYIDNYCERLAPGLWAEPFNAITNLAFLVCAFMVWRLSRRLQRQSVSIDILVSLLVAIGIGSGLFHTFANHATQLMDVVPISLFQVGFLWLYLRRIANLDTRITGGIVLVFLIGGWWTSQWTHYLNGSLGYAPALLFVAGLATYHWRHARNERYALVHATLLFAIALTFRTMDLAICPTFPVGVHFLWHLCNAGVLYLSMRALLANYPHPT